MSESVATVIKILSSLTSPKASVKYISVGIFMLLTWKFISKSVDVYGIPNEQKSVIVLFIGLGLGSLIGHFIYVIFDFYFSKYKASKEETAKKLAIKLAEEERQKVEESSNIEILDRFKKVYPHYDYWTTKVLRELSVKDRCLEWGSDDVDVPKRNGYIQKVVNIDGGKDIYKLHPALTDFVTNEWSVEVNTSMSDFFDDFSANKQALLKLLEFGNRDLDGPLEVNYINISRYYKQIFNIEVEDETGFYISLEQPYHDLICEKLKVELSDETYILKSRICLKEDVA